MVDISSDFVLKLRGINEKMSVSQVVAFFSRNGKTFTNTMIQHYVRVGVLPSPAGKRYYTKNHILLLHMIDDLKNIYSLDDLKIILEPLLSNFDSIDLCDVFVYYAAYYNKIRKELSERNPCYEISDAQFSENSVIQNFLPNLYTIAVSLAARETALHCEIQ